MHTESTNMSNINRIPNSLLPDRLYGEHYPDSFLDMPGSIRTTSMGCVDNFDKHLRKVNNKSDKCDISGESDKSSESNKHSYDCAGSHHAKCDYPHACAIPCGCDHTIGTTRGEGGVNPNHLGNIRCPESGKLCHSSVCRDECAEWLETRNKERKERRERNK
mgnify:CR=1 FL=1